MQGIPLNKKIFLHFEGIMGKSKIYLNGKLIKEHFGGYLPVIIDVSHQINPQGENLLAVWADNSNDPNYPPGKPQQTLDFTYAGGIYRDCWLITHDNLHITDPNFTDLPAGGGLLVAYKNVSEKQATVQLRLHVKNESPADFSGKIRYEIRQRQNHRLVAKSEAKISLKQGTSLVNEQQILLKNPELWSPESPHLYNLFVTVEDGRGRVRDGYRRRIGVRSFEFRGKEGFWLNGKPYGKPLIGANRHQDFAVIGNALSNRLHGQDAKKLRDAGLKVIRNAHYPQDPAFMDACDELGLFVIVNTPGWQFWSENPVFENRVYSDIRNMVRSDRNHPSVWLWEPILNETRYPEYFAKRVKQIVEEEFPFAPCYTACDLQAKGSEHFPVLFAHPASGDQDKHDRLKNYDENKTYFTREWGDNVDNWASHNSPSRVARNWGERPMLVQANHYAHPPYPYTSYDLFYKLTPQHVGGALWHSFDHQRGYHSDPFYGGIMDAFRQPKTSYYLFQAQRPVQKDDSKPYQTGAMVHIAHQMTPFSGEDVQVFSNCQQVRLTFTQGGETFVHQKDTTQRGMPSPMITFPKVYDFMKDKALTLQRKEQEVFLLAEGIENGKVVATHKVFPVRRPTQLLLWTDAPQNTMQANGSDILTLVAAVADANGNIKRLNNSFVSFHVEGEGELLANEQTQTNPVQVQWGTAPVLLRSTTRAGEVKVTASVLFEGSQQPTSAQLILQSVPASQKMIFSPAEAEKYAQILKEKQQQHAPKNQSEAQRTSLQDLKQVEKQQTEFGE